MKTENSNAIGAALRTALLLALLSGVALVSGCNKPVEEPPVPTEANPPPPTEAPQPAPTPTDQNPELPPADDPAYTPAPTDSDAPPSGG